LVDVWTGHPDALPGGQIQPRRRLRRIAEIDQGSILREWARAQGGLARTERKAWHRGFKRQQGGSRMVLDLHLGQPPFRGALLSRRGNLIGSQALGQ
jgi:hypothetical protein